METSIETSYKQMLQDLTKRYPGIEKELQDLLSLASQVNIKASEIDVPTQSVIKRYKVTEAMEVLRCQTMFCFHTPYMWIISKPSFANNYHGGALFEALRWYCDYQDERASLEESPSTYFYDNYCNMILSILMLPLDAFTDEEYMANVGEKIAKERNNLFIRTMNKIKETPSFDSALDEERLNQYFEQEYKMTQAMLAEMAKEAGTKS